MAAEAAKLITDKVEVPVIGIGSVARHLRELAEAAEAGYEAYVLFLIQMKGCRVFLPNRETDPAFAAALRDAAGRGVKVLCYDCLVTEDSMTADLPVPVLL